MTETMPVEAPSQCCGAAVSGRGSRGTRDLESPVIQVEDARPLISPIYEIASVEDEISTYWQGVLDRTLGAANWAERWAGAGLMSVR